MFVEHSHGGTLREREYSVLNDLVCMYPPDAIDSNGWVPTQDSRRGAFSSAQPDTPLPERDMLGKLMSKIWARESTRIYINMYYGA